MLYWASSDLKAELRAGGAVRGGMRGPGVAGVQFALGWNRDGPVCSSPASTVYML